MDLTEASSQVGQLVAAGVPAEDIAVRQPCPVFGTSWGVTARISGPLRVTSGTNLRLHPELKVE
ncbi:hypothetical protein [Streptomyces sp. DH37]|uniref:hypothetical protein n=1 Tax=Streptomyces sp. DH37 TaxID=3040122 RepID=UPI002441783A|nr:hypothetical protein [Streptomyces sp. DH37]MDG9701647.1 hypothetical protein [Streptomyces sp. DH37]